MAESKGDQYRRDLERFVHLMHKYTKIPVANLTKALKERPAADIFSLTHLICASDDQRRRLGELHELKNTYENLKEFGNDEYIIRDTTKAGQYHLNFLKDVKNKEMFLVTCLDNSNRVLKTTVISEGTINEAAVYQRELLKDILFYNATSVIIAHNHPGGSKTFSSADQQLTETLRSMLSKINIRLLDHILVAGESYASYEETQQQMTKILSRRDDSNSWQVSEVQEVPCEDYNIGDGAEPDNDLECYMESDWDEEENTGER